MIRAKKFSSKPRRFKPLVSYSGRIPGGSSCKKERYTFIGGPYDKCKVYLCSSGTLEFVVSKNSILYKGYYDINNQWVSTL